jgi:hypothetical protein
VGRSAEVPFQAGARDISLLRIVQTDCEAHPASYPMDTGGVCEGETDSSLPFSAEVKCGGAMQQFPYTPSCGCASLIADFHQPHNHIL